MPDDAVIISAVRTPIGRAGGALASVSAWDLATIVAKEAVARARTDPAGFDDVIFGETVGGGGGVGRYVGLAAGVPVEVPGLSVIRACATGLEAVTQAALHVRAGQGEAYLTGGVESMSNQPWLMSKPDRAFPRKPPPVVVAPPSHPPDMAPLSVGINTGENVADKYGVTREDQDRWALRSHQRAVLAMDEGRFDREIVPVDVAGRGGPATVAADEHPRRDTTLEALAKLPPVYKEGGTVTAGNASGINDAAASIVVTSAARAAQLGLAPRARIRAWASAGVDPNVTGIAPVFAVPKALARAGLTLGDVDLIELNEAFAAMTVACVRELGLDEEKVNVNGGAIALGHPVGATGARLLVTLLHELERCDATIGVATMCAGGGMGSAAVIERV
ncbi:MAG TPA: thiolase family protein [Actinomycetota bacterium]